MSQHGDHLSDEERRLIERHRAGQKRSVFAPEPKSGMPTWAKIAIGVVAVGTLLGLVILVWSLLFARDVMNAIEGAGQGGSQQAGSSDSSVGVRVNEEQQEVLSSGSIDDQNRAFDDLFGSEINQAIEDYYRGETSSVDLSALSSDPAVGERMKFLVDQLAEQAGETEAVASHQVSGRVCATYIDEFSLGACTENTSEYVGTPSGEVELVMQIDGEGDLFTDPLRSHYEKYESGLVTQVDGDIASLQLY